MKKLRIITGAVLLFLSSLVIADPVYPPDDQAPVCISNESGTILKACQYSTCHKLPLDQTVKFCGSGEIKLSYFGFFSYKDWKNITLAPHQTAHINQHD